MCVTLLTEGGYSYVIDRRRVYLYVLQEPGSNEEIFKFVMDNYGVTFDLFSKVDVNGDEEGHPLWAFLKCKQGGIMGE